MTDLLVAMCTCPDDVVASRIAEALVREGLAACVNRVPGLRSIYMWQGQLQSDQEVLLLIKTTKTRFTALNERINALHPYELPELIALPVVAGSADYLAWVQTAVAQP